MRTMKGHEMIYILLHFIRKLFHSTISIHRQPTQTIQGGSMHLDLKRVGNRLILFVLN